MRLGKLGVIVLPCALAGTPATVAAQPSIDVNVDLNIPGEAVPSVDVFYDQLSPYGVWVDDNELGGQVFIPNESGYVPYTNGHWEYTDMGMVWVSDEPFAWATSHYGRWSYSDPYNRWVWLPDTTWGPSWVEWYEADDDFGWRPLAPQIVIDAGYQQPVEAWHFCRADHILDTDLRRYYEPRDRVITVQRQARPVQHTVRVANHEVVAGPAPQKLQEHHVAARPKKVEAKKIGLMQPAEVRTATERAKQRLPQIQAQNRKRVDSNPTLRDAEQRAKTREPAKQTTRTNPTTPTTRTTPTTPTRPETRTNPRDENRTDTRTNTRTPTDTRTTPTPPTRPETRTNPRDENRNDTRPAPRPEPQRTEPTRPEPQRTQPTRPEPQRTEPARPEPQRTDRPDQRSENRAQPQPPRAENRPAQHEQRAENRPEPKRQNDKRKDTNKRD